MFYFRTIYHAFEIDKNFMNDFMGEKMKRSAIFWNDYFNISWTENPSKTFSCCLRKQNNTY